MEKDPESSLKLNVEATRELAEAVSKYSQITTASSKTILVDYLVDSVGGRLLYISTDYVFDGKSPPYHPDSVTNPLNFYGQSKLDGEKVVLEANTSMQKKSLMI